MNHFFDLGGSAAGLALVRELVARGWPALPTADRDDLVQEGYLELETLRADYDPRRSHLFEPYARRILPLRLRALAHKLRPPDSPVEDDQLAGLEFASAAERARAGRKPAFDQAGWFPLGRAPAESSLRARLEAQTEWFGASALPEVAAVHSGEGYRLSDMEGASHLLASQPQLLHGFQAELRLAVVEEGELRDRELIEHLRASAGRRRWADAAEALAAIERLGAFAPAPNLTAWLRSATSPLNRSEALRIKRVVAAYCERGDLGASDIDGVSLQKLDCLVPAVNAGLLLAAEAVGLARSQSVRALRARASQLREQA